MLNTIVQLTLPDGEVIDIVDWTDKPIYSSFDLQSGFEDEELVLFQYVESNPVPNAQNPAGPAATARNATLEDTNLQSQGSMADTEEMLVYAIKPELYFFQTEEQNDFTTRAPTLQGQPMATPSGLAVLHSRTILQLNTEEKNYAEAGLGYFNTGFGPHGTAAAVPGTAAAAAVNQATAGLPSQEAVRSLFVPIHLTVQSKFNVTLVNPGDGPVDFGVDEASPRVSDDNTMATLRVNLDGLYKRPTA